MTTFKWATTVKHIKNYAHDIDAASKHSKIDMIPNDYLNDTFKLFIKDNGNISISIEIYKNKILLKEKKFSLAVDREHDPNRFIYSTFNPHIRVTPNNTTTYNLVQSHSNFHSEDFDIKNNVFDLNSQNISGSDGFQNNWTPFEINNSDKINQYNGTSFLGWHHALLRAKNQWDEEFGYPRSVANSYSASAPMPTYLSPTGGTDRPYFGGITWTQAKLSDFKSLEELGDSIGAFALKINWHGNLHFSGGSELKNCTVAPHEKRQKFWEIHEAIDSLVKDANLLKLIKIEVIAGVGGKIIGSASSGKLILNVPYDEDSPFFSAEADEGYEFDVWNDGSNLNPRKISPATSDRSISAKFKKLGN